MKILFLDDDCHKMNSLLYCFYEDDVEISNNFMDGLKKVCNNNFDLLVLDMNFPITENGKIHKLGIEFLDMMQRKKIFIPTIIYSSELYDVSKYNNIVGYLKYNILFDYTEKVDTFKSKVLILKK